MKAFGFLRWLMAVGVATFAAGAVLAQSNYPARPIRIVVGFGPGGATDAVARLYAGKLQEVLGVPVTVENKAGAGQTLALLAVKSAPADGYTLLFATSSVLVQSPGVRSGLNYDPIKDVAPIALIGRAPAVFYVNPQLPVQTMQQLITYARANPGKINYASAGIGAANHLQMEAVLRATGTQMVHIPFKSDSEVAQQIASGQDAQLAISTPQLPIALASAGKARILAVTGSTRLAELPSTPTVAEAGIDSIKGFDYYSFYGLLGPAGLPAALVSKVNEAVNKVSQMPEVEERMRKSLYVDVAGGTPSFFADYLAAELAKWREVGKTLKIE